MYRSEFALAVGLFVLASQPGYAHECPDPLTKDLDNVLFVTLMTYPTKPLSEQAIQNYKYVVFMADRPVDKPRLAVACQWIVETLRENGQLEARASDYANCPMDIVADNWNPPAIDPDSFNTDEAYLPIVRVQPVYPSKALRKKLSGWVVIEFTVTPEGKVSSPKIVHSTDKLFNHSALRGIEKFKYKPRHKDGRPVAVPGVRAKIAFDYEETSHPDHCN